MKLFKAVCLGLLALTALASVAVASASASPTAVLLSGESFPVEVNGTKPDPNTIKTELQNAAGVLKGEGYLLEITLTSWTAGTFEALRLKFKTTKVKPAPTKENACEIIYGHRVAGA